MQFTKSGFSISMSHPEGSNTDKRQFLVIEDEIDLAELIKLHLQDLHADITLAHDGVSGLRLAIEKPWDVIILDLRLPGKDGLDVCRELRAAGIDCPLLMLTSRSTELDRVLGLELGADDYLTKPFSTLELVARIKALLRRSEIRQMPKTEETKFIHQGFVQLDFDKRIATVRKEVVDLTAKEFELLWYFASQPGKVFTRADLLSAVWGYGHDGYDHTVNSHINRLRSKIEQNPADPSAILTVWGVGYKFNDNLTEAPAEHV